MVNPLKGEVELVAGDKSYVLRFSSNEVCSVEEAMDKGFHVIAQELADPEKLRFSTVRHLLHVSLAGSHPGLSLMDAGDIMTAAGGMEKALEKISEAMLLSFNKTTEVNGAKRPTTRRKEQTG